MIRPILSAAVLTASLVSPLASQASMFGRTPETAASSTVRGKMVKLTLKNNTNTPMTVYLDGKPMTLAANGGKQEVKAAVGSDILDADQTTVRLHVTNEVNGNTVAFR